MTLHDPWLLGVLIPLLAVEARLAVLYIKESNKNGKAAEAAAQAPRPLVGPGTDVYNVRDEAGAVFTAHVDPDGYVLALGAYAKPTDDPLVWQAV